MQVSEFIDTYADDLRNLHEARMAQLTHPLRGDFAFKQHLDASYCRILAVFVVGGLEAMLESWRDRDRVNVLEKYFAKNVKNGERIASLLKAFTDAGIKVDSQVFNDYLAIKYLRNTIIHAGWKDYERAWLIDRGFPTDTRKLTTEHFDRIEHVNQNMMLYIALTAVADPNGPKPDKLIRLDQTITQRPSETTILRTSDLPRILWNNLERIDYVLSRVIEAVSISDEYCWTEGRERAELEQLGNDACKRLLYLAARRAGEDNHPEIVKHRPWAEEALAFWREYRQRATAAADVTEDQIAPALDVLESEAFARIATGASWCSQVHNLTEESAHLLLGSAFKEGAPFTIEQVVRAFRTGARAYDLVPNILPVALFTVRLPLVDPENTPTYLREARQAYQTLKLNRAWYSWAEHNRAPATDELEFYAKMSEELARR